MPPQSRSRLFVLDTNVLMHDPSCLFRFEEHDVFIPMVALEELDAAKKGLSEAARNVRRVSRFIENIINDAGPEAITNGLGLDRAMPLNGHGRPAGRLFLQTRILPDKLPRPLPGNNADDAILGATLALQKKDPDRRVTLVTRDINLRIKARACGIHTEDYTTDKALDDVDLLYTGISKLPADCRDLWPKTLTAGARYAIKGRPLRACYPHQSLYSDRGGGFEALVKEIGADKTILARAADYRKAGRAVWGVHARNREQNFALNLLLDADIDLVTLLGAAGAGKTLLALAAGLEQVLDKKRYREIIITRVTIPVGEDIGFLPGTEEEKMAPWMGALLDNLEVLTQSDDGGEWERAAAQDLLNKRIKLRSLNFMRGRTFLNRYIIVDEAQNLTAGQMKTLLTRAGPGSKLVILGNITQIDTPYLTETTSGLTYAVDRFKHWQHSGHITLQRGERSRLADFAGEVL